MGIMDTLFGGGSGYQAQKYDIDENAYADPNAQKQVDSWNAKGNTQGNQQQITAAQSAQQVNNGPQTAQAAQLGNSDARMAQAQNQLVGQLQQQASGQGPSVAAANFNAGNDAAMRQQLSLAATGGGALGLRQAMVNGANASQANAQALVAAKAQEQLNAQNALSQTASTARGQDLTKASENANLNQSTNQFNATAGNQNAQYYAGLNQNTNQFNAQAQNAAQQANQSAGLNQQQINNQNSQYYDQLVNNRQQQDIQNQMKLQSGQVNNNNAYEQIASGNANAAASRTGMLGSALSGAASMAANYFTGGAAGAIGGAMKGSETSDRNAKTDITDSEQLGDLFANLSAYDYRYKDPKEDGEGIRSTVMAQDLEKSELGKRAVVEEDGKKKVDYGELLAPMFAQTAELTKQVASLKGKGK